MSKKPFSNPVSRLFPNRIVKYYQKLVDKIIADYSNDKDSLSDSEYSLIQEYNQNLNNSKIYYEKANLEFIEKAYPSIINNTASESIMNLYSEMMRINPRLATLRMGQNIMFNKTFK